MSAKPAVAALAAMSAQVVLLGGECSCPVEEIRPFVCRIAEGAKPWERVAYDELNDYLTRVADSRRLTVAGLDQVVFHVGDSEVARRNGLAASALQDEEWVVRSFGRDVVLNGGGSRGCLYAVSHFLEDQCGVRWWYDGDEDVPDARPLCLPMLDRRGKPRFLYRDIYRQPSNDVVTAVHNRVNGNGDGRIPAAFGGGCEFGPPYHCHTWDKLVPFKTYGKAHPEWYSLVNGRRQGGPEMSGPDAGQLCLTADGLVDFFAEQVEKAIAEGESAAKAAGKPAPMLYDISMNDNKSYCQCKKCLKVREKYGHSGEQLLFENEVARRVGAKHPDILFSVLAYYEAEEVPRGGVRAADNVVVKLTNTRANMAAGIFERSNRFMHDRIAEWRKYAKHLIVWDYLVTFAGETKGYPFASEYYIGERFKYCAENGVIGFLLEQEEPDVGDMYDLKYRVASRFMEDPDCDLKALMDDFYSCYFGAAGAKIRAAREHLDRIRRERGGFVTWFPQSGEFSFIRQEDVDRMVALWDEAETLVRKDTKRLGRVRRARRGLDRLKSDRDRAAKYWKAAEAGVSDRAFVDCPVTKPGYVRHMKGIDLVDDVSSSCGKALRIPLSLNAHCRLPFEIGAYSPALQKGLAGKRWEKPLGVDYCWYELGEVDLPESHYVFFTRGWYVQVSPPVPELAGRKCRIRARVRITEKAVFLDRTVFIPMDREPVAAGFHGARSPDGRNEIRLWTDPLSYEVLRDGVSVLAKTEIGLKVDGSFLPTSADPRISTERRTGRVATPVYKKSEVDLTGNETLVDFGDWAVRLAARDDGVAYRFEIKRAGGIVVDAERADVTVQDEEAVCRVYSTDRVGCEEAVPERLPWREARERIRDKTVYLPFVYETAGKTVAVTESDVRDYPIWNLGSKFARAPKSTRHTRNAKADFARHIPVGTGGRWVDVVESEDFLVRTAGRRTFPWRVFIAVDEPCRLCESDAVFALAEPADAKDDFSWVRPGKVAWDWWNGFDNQGEKGCNTATYLRFVDFAASNGVEYVILDEGWSAELDIWRSSAAVDLPKILGYARERGVGIILWLAWAQAYGDEGRVAGHFAKLGAKGFKVDFMDRGDAAVSLFLERFAAACARHRMLVDYHGAYRPTGLQRKYPNIVNYEGVHGLENLKWYAGRDMTSNELCAFFCRMTAGPLDFTPGAIDNYAVGAYPRAADTGGGAAAMTLEASLAFCNSPGSIGTRTRQMAMLVAYEAPLQMLCDSPTKYGRNRECFAFMSATPTVWDETVGLGGNPDDYAAIARRSGESWYVAAIANANGTDVALNTRFLGDGDWTMEFFRDAEDADVEPSHYIHSWTTLRAGEPIGLRLAPGGGFVARLARK